MGGGAGVCVHGRFRIATENTVFLFLKKHVHVDDK